MTGRELLQAMGDVDESYIHEAEFPTEKRRPRARILLIAAALALLLAGCTYAMLHLQDLKIRDIAFPTTEGEEPDIREVLSLVGSAGSPQYLAAKDWLEFVDSYDPDGTIYDTAAYHGYDFPEPYSNYRCYTQEMADKVDEICEKYDLIPHGKGWRTDNATNIFKALGIENISRENRDWMFSENPGSCYDDGSFYVSGWINFPGRTGDWFSFDSIPKGVFGCSTNTVPSIDAFTQWNYRMKDGTQTRLAVSDDEGIILVDREDCYISVSVVFYDPIPEDVSGRKTLLEGMTEFFDFTYQFQGMDREALDAADAAFNEVTQASIRRSFENDFRRANYKANIYHFSTFYEDSENMDYVLLDLNGDGTEELITAYDGDVETIITQKEWVTQLVMGKQWDFWGRRIQICEGNRILCYRENGPCKEYAFYRMEGDVLVLADLLEYHDHPGEQVQWTRTREGLGTNLTEDEARAVIELYPPLDLPWKPISEFPKDQ